MDDALYWEAPEYEHIEKDSEWFWVLGVIVASISVAAILLDNVLFGVFVLLAGITLALHARKGPALVRIAITDAGISIGNDLKPYEMLRSFSFDRHLLLLERQALLHSILIVPVAEDMPLDQVRFALMKKMPEKTLKEPLSHRLLQYLVF
jgi:hypothetical protein